MNDRERTIRLCSDGELGYERSRTSFIDGRGLRLDESYRLAHLPLVAPEHPLVIARHPDKDYDKGIHVLRIFSLVLPIPWAALDQSPAFHRMDAEVRHASFGQKINWARVHERRHKLHATVCNSISVGDAPQFTNELRHELKSVGPIHCEIRGLFSGTLNVGRLYLKVYPERKSEGNPLHRIQQILGARLADVYLVGLYNLVDDLGPDETSALSAVIGRWWHTPLAHIQSVDLAVMGTLDDLALNSMIVERISHSHP